MEKEFERERKKLYKKLERMNKELEEIIKPYENQPSSLPFPLFIPFEPE
jgi:hypothetical protein